MPLCNSWRKCLITSYCTKPPSLDGSLDDNNYPDLAFVSLCNPRKPHYQILTIFTNCKCTILIFVIIFIIYVHAETNSLKISKLKSIARWIYFLENVSDHITQADLGFYLGGLVGLAEIYTMRICRKLTLLKLSKNKKWSSGVWSALPKNLCLQGNLRKLLLNDITMLIYISTDMLHIFLHNNYISAKYNWLYHQQTGAPSVTHRLVQGWTSGSNLQVIVIIYLFIWKWFLHSNYFLLKSLSWNYYL